MTFALKIVFTKNKASIAGVFKISVRTLYAIGYSISRVKAGQPVGQRSGNIAMGEAKSQDYGSTRCSCYELVRIQVVSVVKGKKVPEVKKITDA